MPRGKRFFCFFINARCRLARLAILEKATSVSDAKFAKFYFQMLAISIPRAPVT